MFYGGILGLTETPKPPQLAGRGGAWFRGAVELHLGVDNDFLPARKAHPALRATDLTELVGRLIAAGHPVRWDTELPGVARCFVDDPFGNRIELISVD